MIPNPIPKGTTRQQWEQYELEQKNHDNWIKNRREFMERILVTVSEFGIEKAREIHNRALDNAQSMDAPNPPGYYRANND